MGAIDTITAALSNVLPTLPTSNGSIESKIIDVVGTYADSEAIERDNTLTTINEALANQKVTNKSYYRRVAVEFQQGDTLLYDPINQGGYYDPINEQNRIVRQAYVVGQYPSFTMLVNGIGADGHLRKLDQVELDSFRTYFEAFQPLGMDININSLEVAKISDPNIVIYVRAGTDAGTAASVINANLKAYESVARANNTVSLSEIEDVIQQNPDVRAVGFGNIVASEVQLDGTTIVNSYPVKGVFTLTNGAFTFTTTITTNMIKTIT